MVAENNTPEERLLKIIEKKGTSVDSGEKEIQRQKANLERKRWFFSFKNMRFSDLSLEPPAFTLQFVNKMLIIAAILFTLIFVFDFLRDKVNLRKHFALVTGVPTISKVKIKKDSELKISLATALKETRTRNMFTLTPETIFEEKKEKNEKIRKDIRDLKLVGILWSNSPQAMVEDVKNSKTYLLSVGDVINRWTVSKIDRDKVILLGEEGEMDLR